MAYTKKNIVIIGAGPAALSMSATLSLANIEHVILEKGSGAGGIVSQIHNELDDFVVGTINNGREMQQLISAFVNKYQLPIRYNCKVTGIDTGKKIISFKRQGVEEKMNYDFAIIATGSRFKIDDISKNKKWEQDIYYRISYNLEEFAKKKVAVIGSGDNATIAALRLTEYANKIYLINKSQEWNSRKDLVEQVEVHSCITVLNDKSLVELKGKSSLEAIEIKDINSGEKTILEIDKIVFKIGYVPNSDFISGGIELDTKGYIVVYDRYKTSAHGVYAIGDIVASAYKRIAIAMGQGTELGNYFLKELLE